MAEQAEYTQALRLDSLETKDVHALSGEERAELAQLRIEKPRKMFFHLNPDVLIWVVCVVVMLDAVAGGLEAAFLTDTLQGIFIIILTLLLFPFAWAKINAEFGGEGFMGVMEVMHARLPHSYFEIFGSPVTQDFTWYYIAALTLMITVNVVIQPNSLIATGSAKGEYECRFGFVAGSDMKRICTVLWGFFALLAVVLYHDKVNNPDLVWGYATLDLLGPLNLGLVGLMITGSSLITHNVYRPLVAGKSERHYVTVGRVAGALVVIGGALIATQFDTILQQLKFWWELNVMVAAAFWVGMKWRRATRPAAWCSMVVTMVVFFLLPIALPVLVPSLKTNETLLKTTDAHVITRTYTATEMEVEQRNEAIREWNENQTGERPEAIKVGDSYTRAYTQPSRAIFWTKGIKVNDAGQKQGGGTLSLELVLLDKMGIELGGNPYALNETIRILIRTIVPFLILVGVSLATRRDDKALLDRFFVRMKTPVESGDPDEDVRQLELSYADPRRFDDRNLFGPGSDWEFNKWTRTDAVGFAVSGIIAVGVILLLVGLISLGG